MNGNLVQGRHNSSGIFETYIFERRFVLYECIHFKLVFTFKLNSLSKCHKVEKPKRARLKLSQQNDIFWWTSFQSCSCIVHFMSYMCNSPCALIVATFVWRSHLEVKIFALQDFKFAVLLWLFWPVSILMLHLFLAVSLNRSNWPLLLVAWELNPCCCAFGSRWSRCQAKHKCTWLRAKKLLIKHKKQNPKNFLSVLL